MFSKLTAVAVILLAPIVAFGQALADRVPSDAMVYIGWQGSEHLGAAYDDSNLKAFLADSQFLQLFNEFLPQLVQKLGQMDPNAAQVGEMVNVIAQPVWKHPTAIFISGIDFNGPNEIVPHLGIVVQAGDDGKALKDKLDQLVSTMGQPPFPVKVLDDGKLVGLLVGYDDEKAALGGDGGNAKALRDNATFKQALAQVGKNPVATVYVDMPRVLKQIDTCMQKVGAADSERKQFEQIRDALGFQQIRQFIAASGFDGKDWGSQLFVAIPAPRTGLFALLEDKPLSDDLLSAIPRTSTMAGAGRFDLSHLLTTVRRTVNQLDRNATRDMDNALRELKNQSDVDLEKDIFGTLGDEWAYFSDPNTGGRGVFGLTMVNRLRDSARFEQSMVKLQDFVAKQANQNIGPSPVPVQIQFHEIKSEGMTIHYLGVPLVEPCWGIKDGTLYAGLYPQIISAAAKNAGRNGQSILQNKGFADLRQRLGGEKATSIQFFDLPQTAPDAYGIWLMITRLSGFGDVFGVKAPPMVMPPLDKLIAHLSPAGQVTWVDDQGLHARALEPFPGSELIASDPWAMLASAYMTAIPVALPAMQKAREQARHAQAPPAAPAPEQ